VNGIGSLGYQCPKTRPWETVNREHSRETNTHNTLTENRLMKKNKRKLGGKEQRMKTREKLKKKPDGLPESH